MIPELNSDPSCRPFLMATIDLVLATENVRPGALLAFESTLDIKTLPPVRKERIAQFLAGRKTPFISDESRDEVLQKDERKSDCLESVLNRPVEVISFQFKKPSAIIWSESLVASSVGAE